MIKRKKNKIATSITLDYDVFFLANKKNINLSGTLNDLLKKFLSIEVDALHVNESEIKDKLASIDIEKLKLETDLAIILEEKEKRDKENIEKERDEKRILSEIEVETRETGEGNY